MFKRFNIGNLICFGMILAIIGGLIALNSYVMNLTHGCYNILDIMFM